MRALLVSLAVLGAACAHQPLSGGDLDRVMRPAFVSRIEEGAGPKANVFRDDPTYSARLKRLDPKEADRRLQVKLATVSRFEISDRFRASTLAHLPKERPWTDVMDPVRVGRQLESFLVEEVPANPPDYDLLKPIGADSVVEFVIEEYGMRSEQGRGGVFIRGYGRMFFIGGSQIWKRAFDADGIRENRTALDPFKVAKDPDLFRNEMAALVDEQTRVFAKDLNPSNRKGGAPLPQGAEEIESPADSTNKTGAQPSESAPASGGETVPVESAPTKKKKPEKKKRDDDSPLPSMEDQPAPIEQQKPVDTGS